MASRYGYSPNGQRPSLNTGGGAWRSISRAADQLDSAIGESFAKAKDQRKKQTSVRTNCVEEQKNVQKSIKQTAVQTYLPAKVMRNELLDNVPWREGGWHSVFSLPQRLVFFVESPLRSLLAMLCPRTFQDRPSSNFSELLYSKRDGHSITKGEDIGSREELFRVQLVFHCCPHF